MLNASIDTTARKTGQWTGWKINGFLSGPTFAGSDTSVLNDAVFTDSTLSAPVWGEAVWGDWIAEPGENPADCLRNNTDPGVPVVTNLFNEQQVVSTDEGDVVLAGPVTNVGTPSYGTPYSTGTAKVFATIKSDTHAIN